MLWSFPPHHHSLGRGAVCADDGGSRTDDGGGQRRLDGVGELSELWVLLPDVLHHLRLAETRRFTSSNRKLNDRPPVSILPCCCTAWRSAGSRPAPWRWCRSAGCACSAWGPALRERRGAASGCWGATRLQGGSSGCELFFYWHFYTPAETRVL